MNLLEILILNNKLQRPQSNLTQPTPRSGYEIGNSPLPGTHSIRPVHNPSVIPPDANAKVNVPTGAGYQPQGLLHGGLLSGPAGAPEPAFIFLV